MLVKADVPEAEETADLINDLILKSQVLLANHPVNKKRIAEGKDPANSIWPWSPAYRPSMPTLPERQRMSVRIFLSGAVVCRAITK